ncbi:hypothetical protein DFP72DRAFT_1080948 [Ephemerocybe angulata]|uniref:Uncharacterized protein n=1 Tax=Ephemerocybe angulata TaxID=980116 RepID=A0A8H6HC11_9AGAR|nr:hypothetical protein DFP72DRAFT_1080948 [Tulosesus angulatus]
MTATLFLPSLSVCVIKPSRFRCRFSRIGTPAQNGVPSGRLGKVRARHATGFAVSFPVTDVKAQKVEQKPLTLLSEILTSYAERRSPSYKTSSLPSKPQALTPAPHHRRSPRRLLNKLRRQLQVAAVKAHGFGDSRKSFLDDLATLSSGQVFMDELEVKLENATVDLLGSTGSKDQYDDALNAMRTAVEEGILPGGGVALLKASLQLATTGPGNALRPSLLPTSTKSLASPSSIGP